MMASLQACLRAEAMGAGNENGALMSRAGTPDTRNSLRRLFGK